MPDPITPASPEVLSAPFAPDACDGRVVVVDPPPAALTLTVEAAELSAIRLLDAAHKARDQLNRP